MQASQTTTRQVRVPDRLHESWVHSQQQRPQLFAAVMLFDDDNKLFLIEESGGYTLPTALHSCTGPGMPQAAFRSLRKFTWLIQPMKMGLAAVYEPEEREEWFAIIYARMFGYSNQRRDGFVWVRNRQELNKLKKPINHLVQAALQRLPAETGW